MGINSADVESTTEQQSVAVMSRGVNWKKEGEEKKEKDKKRAERERDRGLRLWCHA